MHQRRFFKSSASTLLAALSSSLLLTDSAFADPGYSEYTTGTTNLTGTTALIGGIGIVSGATTEVNLSGETSKVTGSGFYVYEGAFNVLDGGVVTLTDTIKTESRMVISGSGSLVTTGSAYAGSSSSSAVIVLKEGGTLNVGSLVLGGTHGAGVGRLVIGAELDDAPVAAGFLPANSISAQMVSGQDAMVIFNHTNGTTLENPDALTFGANVSGSISLLHNAGHTILTGSSNASGGIQVNGGVLTVNGNANTYSNVSAGGQMIINGYSGDVTILDGGSLVLNGTSTSVDVQGTGVVTGQGMIYGSLSNAGFVNPGNSPGTLTVAANYYQYPTGTLVIEIDGDQHDKLVVSGTAHLGGHLQVNANAPRSGAFEIISAAVVTGTFASTNGGLFDIALSYLNDAVILSFDVVTLSEFADLRNLTPNERSVARNLDRAVKRGKLGNLIGQLYSMSLDDVETSLTLLSPEQLTQVFQLGFSAAQTQFTNVERRLSDVRHGARGFSTNGLSLSNSRGSVSEGGAPIANERNGLTFAGWDGKSLVGKQTVAPILEDSRWSFFATGSGEWADVESTNNVRGSEFTSGGVTVGADYRVCNHLVVGIAGGYNQIESDLSNNGEIEVNSGRASLYASAFSDGFYLNGIVGGAYNSYDTKRGTLGGLAKGDTSGGEFDALIGGGYDYTIGGFQIGPVASLQYTYLGLDSFQETGSSAPQQFSSQSQDSLKSALGLRASYGFNIGGIVLRPEVRAQWQHEYLDSTASLESSFVGGAGVFNVTGVNIGRDSLLLDAGITAQVTPSVSVYAFYTGEMGRTNYSSNAINGGFQIRF